jgi:hypothetical protein
LLSVGGTSHRVLMQLNGSATREMKRCVTSVRRPTSHVPSGWPWLPGRKTHSASGGVVELRLLAITGPNCSGPDVGPLRLVSLPARSRTVADQVLGAPASGESKSARRPRGATEKVCGLEGMLSPASTMVSSQSTRSESWLTEN